MKLLRLINHVNEWQTIGKKLFFLVFLSIACISPLIAQEVWTLEIQENEDESALATLDIAALESLSVGDSFLIQVNESFEYPIQIEKKYQLSNGDRSWNGFITNTGLDYALVTTAGEETAHLILTSPSGIFQFLGYRIDDDVFRGMFNRLEYVRDEVAITDTIVPFEDGSQQPGIETGQSGSFSIVQSVIALIAPIGSNLEFQLTFTNPGNTTKTNLFVDIFFVLENTDLNNLPENCEILQSTDLQPVLSCALGDFAAGDEKNLIFSVSTSEDSHPLVYSTAIVEDTRSDIIVELYRDVVTDTDQDGISDFNEELLGTDIFNTQDEEQGTVIDVLVAYTSEISEIYLGEVETRINQLFNVANKIFADSETVITLRAVGVHEVDYIPAENLFTDLSTISFQSDETMQDLGRRRTLYGGDLVVLFRTGEENGLCGLANLGGKGTQGDLSANYHKDFAYSVINIDCRDDSVLAHEIGHNLGLAHSRREDIDGGTFLYSAGHGEDARYVTVMAFPDDFDVVNRLYRFSDPQRACGPFQCGTDREDQENGADAVYSLNLVKHQVANYYPSQESRIITRKGVSSNAGISEATLGVGVYSDQSTDFATIFSATDELTFRMKISPLPEQVGKDFVTHLVILKDRNNLYQATANNSLIPWNGSLNSLEAVTSPRVMAENELFDVLLELDLQELESANLALNIFIAYRMVDSGELVYGATPLKLILAN